MSEKMNEEKKYKTLKDAHYGSYNVNITFNDNYTNLKNGIYEVAGFYTEKLVKSVSLKDQNPGSELKTVDISNIKYLAPLKSVKEGGKRRNKKTYKRRNKKTYKRRK